MKYRLIFTLLLMIGLFYFPANCQSWTTIDDQFIPTQGHRDIVPDQYKTYAIDPAEIKHILWTAPHEYAQDVSTSPVMIIIGMADGSADIFRIVQYDMMEAELAAQYTNYKTFVGVSISNPYRRMHADWTVNGFRAVISDLDGNMYIDPYQRNDLEHRIAYYRKDLSSSSAWDCGVSPSEFKADDHAHPRFGDCQFRTYRLAQAATGEYSNFFGATNSSQSGLVLSQVVTAVNRVNQVYEAEMSVRLILIGNTTAIFYYDPNGDPFSADACTQLNQNQNNTDAVIGSANYDIGHVFGVGSGGCAGLGVVCVAGNKARGATGLNPPTGDAFYIDYVAHEMGHQFGGDHTFNGTAGSCNGNRVSSSAYEPGSGTTIQAYAGICSSQDIQPHSDPYFHARSLAQINTHLTSTSCASFLTFNNTAPVAGSPPNYTIPISTPFVLTAIASDPENDPISYCWEEYDLEGTSTEPPVSTDTDGPMFRSLSPVSSASRYFPRLSDLTQNTSYAWEVLPSVSRTMNFRMVVRDYHNIGGCTDEDDVIVTTTSTSGPFTVTSQNSGATWTEGSSQVITWNVANTTASPVSCANVDIRLSYDGGFTYPTLLSSNEPNDGLDTITVPPGTSTTARVMVRGSNNIFFDINNANITINQGLPNFTISVNPSTLSECNDGTVQTTVMIGQYMGFTNTVTLSLLNPPAGAVVTFNPQVVIPGNNSVLTISNLNGLFGQYTVTVRGTSTTGSQDVNFAFTLLAPPTSSATLLSPFNNTINVVMTPTLDWQAIAGVTQYDYQVAYDNAFNNVAVSGTVVNDIVQITSPLIVGQQYYWRVRGINSCGSGPWSSTFNFITVACFSLNSTNVPVIIPASGAPTVYSTFNNSIQMTITDLNIINLIGTHSWIDDLKFSLISPQGTERLFWDQPCMDHDDFNINFDDEGQSGHWPCPPVNGATYKPDNSLTVFDGQQASGTWTLKIEDVQDMDGGSLNSWGLKVCGTINCQLVVTQTSGTGTGSLISAINCANNGDTITISSQLNGQTINIGSSPIVLAKNLVFKSLAASVNITGSGVRIFEITSGKTAEFIGITITAGTSLSGELFLTRAHSSLKM